MKFDVVVMHFKAELLPAQEKILIGEFQFFQKGIVTSCEDALKYVQEVRTQSNRVSSVVKSIPMLGNLAGADETVLCFLVSKLTLIKEKVNKFYILEKTDDPKIFKFYMPSTETDIARFKAMGREVKLQVYTPLKLMKELREHVFPRMGVTLFNITLEQADIDPEKED